MSSRHARKHDLMRSIWTQFVIVIVIVIVIVVLMSKERKTQSQSLLVCFVSIKAKDYILLWCLSSHAHWWWWIYIHNIHMIWISISMTACSYWTDLDSKSSLRADRSRATCATFFLEWSFLRKNDTPHFCAFLPFKRHQTTCGYVLLCFIRSWMVWCIFFHVFAW